uniref:Uncharacterized protein n=1 Tax=Arundo donax TaxID=35708 RepID=A0A0A9AQM7_ARUDO
MWVSFELMQLNNRIVANHIDSTESDQRQNSRTA